MSGISTLSPSAGLSNSYSPALNEAQSAAHARAAINSMPVGSSINHLSRVLGGISLHLGTRQEAAGDDSRAPQAESQAQRAARHYAAIEATTKAAGDAPDGRPE